MESILLTTLSNTILPIRRARASEASTKIKKNTIRFKIKKIITYYIYVTYIILIEWSLLKVFFISKRLYVLLSFVITFNARLL